MDQHSSTIRPRIGVMLGDQAGVGPELVAKLLSDPENTPPSQMPETWRFQPQKWQAQKASRFWTMAVLPNRSSPGGCMHQFKRGLQLWRDNKIDALVFAPLNKTSLKKAGMTEENELRWLAKQLNFEGTTSEINIAGPLWTARVTSHVGIEKVAGMISKESTLKAIELLHRLRWESGVEKPRLAVCALNPHNGENGSFGRQEIDHIAPAVREAQMKGIHVQGPFPCDTIFLKRQHFDGIVTMYHDQGQIALKLLSFEGGVTVQGGLPMIIATPAHGTAFDIVGKNVASVTSMQQAFNVAVTMASRRLSKQCAQDDEKVAYTMY
ncbi:hypothetical protein AC579_244 [Pseudocercospora musae]|uniref:4-hydroxythreonine-4-phosphate dehydrogenase n=1 Tax=Pseudocercospora musae TaxID=113226 RepID=A0A139I086_9PEZI|nr:hypothetical protein AC579_244 [Pseudocercospora musae]